jgi:hypothetical protein
LIAAISWLLASLGGFGIVPLIALRLRDTSGSVRAATTAIALVLMWGASIDYCIGLWTGSLGFQATASAVGIGLFVCGAGLLGYRRWGLLERPVRPRNTPADWLAAVCIVALAAGIALCLFSLPLTAWDARSIWMFHGKVIYLGGGLHTNPFWTNNEYDWSHKSYPLFMPMLAAQSARFFGVWNEYAPKGAYIVLAIAGLTGLRAAISSAWGFILVLFAVIGIAGDQSWTGYLDSWMAIFGTIGVLSLTTWLDTRAPRDLVLGMSSLCFALCLKNEAVALIAVTSVVIAAGVVRNRTGLHRRHLALLLLAVPYLSWSWTKLHLGIDGDLEAHGVLARALGVISDPAELGRRLAFITTMTAGSSNFFWMAAAYAALLSYAGFPRKALAGGVIVAGYCATVILVYLGTPYDFVWHVTFSAGRVVFLPLFILLAETVELAALVIRNAGREPPDVPSHALAVMSGQPAR